MDDNLIASYRKSLKSADDRIKRENQDFLKTWDEQQAQAKAQASAPAPAQAPAAKPQQNQRGYTADIGIGVVGGMRDSVQDFIDAGVALHNWTATNQWEGYKLPDVKTETTVGGLTRGITDFMTTFIPMAGAVGKGAKALKVGTKIASVMSKGVVKGAIAGAGADFIHNPYEERLSNLLASSDNPIFNNAVTQYLKADKDDGQLEGRLKNVLEGAGLGMMTEGLLAGLKKAKAGINLFRDGKGSVADAFDNTLHEARVEQVAAQKQEFRDVSKMKANASADKKTLSDLKDTYDNRKFMESRNANVDKAAYEANVENIKLTQGEMTRKIPEDYTLRSLDEQADIRNWAAEHGIESVSELLDLVAKKEDPETIIKAVSPEDGSLIRVSREGVYNSTREETVDAWKEAEKTAADVVDDAQSKTLVTTEDGLERPKDVFDRVAEAAQDIPEELPVPAERTPRTKAAKPDGKPKAAPGKTGRRVGRPTKAEADAPPPFQKFVEAKGIEWPTDDNLAEALGADRYKDLVKEFRDQAGFATPQMMASIASGGIGGGVGLKYDFDGDGELSLGDFAIGFVAGGSIPFIAHYLRKAKDPDAAVTALKDEKSKALMETKQQIEETLKGPLSDATRQKLRQHLETINGLVGEVQKIKGADDLVKRVTANPANAAVYRKTLEPKVKVKEGNVDAFMEKMKNGDFDGATDHIDIDYKAAMQDEQSAMSILDSMNEVFSKEIEAARGNGPIPWTVTQKLADTVGDSVSNINKVYGGSQQLHAKALAAYQTSVKLQNGLQDTIRKAVESGDNSAKTLLEVRQMVSLVAGVNAQIKGYRSEMGRAFNAMKLFSRYTTDEMLDVNRLEKALSNAGGRVRNEEMLKQLLELPTIRQKNLYAKSLSQNPALNALMEVYYGAMLSAPHTWFVNGMSGAITTTFALGEKAAQAAVDRSTQFGEVAAMWHGVKSGLGDAIQMASKSFRTETQQFDALTKIGHETDKAITSELLTGMPRLSGWLDQLGVKEYVGSFLDAAGQFTRFGERVLMSTDDFWKAVNHRMSLHQQGWKAAYEQAAKEGLDDSKLPTRIAELYKEMIDSPSSEMLQNAMDFARYQTFTNPTEWNGPVGVMGKMIESGVSHAAPLRFFVPFVRTATNIGGYVSERTPLLNLLAKNSREALFRGSSTERAAEMAKLAVGGTFLASGVGLAEMGLLTGGGPKDTSAKRVSGWQPYSIKIGDKYFSYNRLDPVGAFLGTVGDYYDLVVHSEDDVKWHQWASGAVLAFSKNFLSKQYLQGLAKLIDILNNPDQRGERWAQRFISGFVPAGMAAVEKVVSPEFSEVFNMFDDARARVPFASDALTPKRDLFGEPVSAQGWRFSHLFNPFTYSSDSPDPVNREFSKLRGISPKAFLNEMRQIDGVQLSPEQYDKYVESMGGPLKEDLGKLMASDGYQNAPYGQMLDSKYVQGMREEMVSRMMNLHRMRAKGELLNLFPDLRQQLQEHKQSQTNIKFGQ